MSTPVRLVGRLAAPTTGAGDLAGRAGEQPSGQPQMAVLLVDRIVIADRGANDILTTAHAAQHLNVPTQLLRFGYAHCSWSLAFHRDTGPIWCEPTTYQSLPPDQLAGFGDTLTAHELHRLRTDLARLPITDLLRHYLCRELLTPDDAITIASTLAVRPIKWGFAHGGLSARTLIKEPTGVLAVIDWETAGIYPASYDLAFLWFTTRAVPDARQTIEAAVSANHRSSFLVSAATPSCPAPPRASRPSSAASDSSTPVWSTSFYGAVAKKTAPTAST